MANKHNNNFKAYKNKRAKAERSRNFQTTAMRNLLEYERKLICTESVIRIRVLNTNYDNSDDGVFTNKPGVLTNDYFSNLLDMNITWKETDTTEQRFVGTTRKTKKAKWKGTRVDLIFGSNSELRSISEVYACNDSEQLFLNDFVSAWTKVMNLDRF